MAARRPAPPPPLPAEQMPGQQGGGLTGMGGRPQCRAASGGFPSSPAAHPTSLPRGCQRAGDSRPPKDVLGSQRLGWPKVTAKATGELQLVSALARVPRPLTLQCHGCSCPVPVQRGGHVTLVPPRLPQHPDSSSRSPAMANCGLIPLQQHIPPPPCTVHPGGLRVKAQIPGAALM